jgi:signal transduction histidine kinase
MLALAGAAGSAIGNARLHRELHRQHLWLQAAVEVGARVLSPTGEDALRLVARRALDVADADVVSVAILDPDGDALIVEAAVGRNAESLVGRQLPVADGPFGETVRTGIPRRVGAEELPAGRWGEPAFGGGSTMLLPLAGMAGPRGVLAVARREGRPDFPGRELELAASFAAHAGVAVQLVDSRLAEQRLALLEDRDRIAMDLHDHVIQELFAIGMNFEAAALRSTDADLAARIRRGVESIDATIRRIRSSIFQLRVPSRGELRDRILQLNGELSEVLGFVPGLTVSGPLGNLQDAALVDDVVASLRESLTNVARHAHATAVTVDLVVGDGQLTMTVTDNGLGLPVSTNRRSGLANLRARAEHHAGSFEIGAAPGGGTAVRWTVRLP